MFTISYKNYIMSISNQHEILLVMLSMNWPKKDITKKQNAWCWRAILLKSLKHLGLKIYPLIIPSLLSWGFHNISHHSTLVLWAIIIQQWDAWKLHKETHVHIELSTSHCCILRAHVMRGFGASIFNCLIWNSPLSTWCKALNTCIRLFNNFNLINGPQEHG